ncbi:protein of unknown function [Taphrina deformans PYCC 5710]|uniref:Uncharacterized protein n=1 Tax=Taphrina deformans (strain PYCC 5710 / ATCC 11124 / CBS 356.35 / IMI 108563 / JCM 9778 / NBRC 8474) TaxID=1097556 RepID=R4X918_TAPDE|nr:protein of unknown function [Taphrina deformans PYCC 5710]|eukprot:CCG82143.1 protein of unknown function [Taphrina deformans PYCC 5710]
MVAGPYRSKKTCFVSKKSRKVAVKDSAGNIVTLIGIWTQDVDANPLLSNSEDIIIPEFPRVHLSDPPTSAETALVSHYQKVQQLVIELKLGIAACLAIVESSKADYFDVAKPEVSDLLGADE